MITNTQLDKCHGHTASVMWDGKMISIYHYHVNREYPYSVGCFHGVVDYAKALPNSDMTQGLDYGKIVGLIPSIATAIPSQNLEQDIKILAATDQLTIFQFLSKIINNFLK